MVYPFTSARVINVLILTLILSGQACAHFHARSTQLKSHIPRAKDNVRGSHGVKKRWPEDRSRKATKGPNIVFPKSYHATGLLTLPYDGIMEPFEIWYAEKHRMSRIDYYHGRCMDLAVIIFVGLFVTSKSSSVSREGKGREGKGREGKGREGKGREGKGREGKGREGKGRKGRKEGREGGKKEGRDGKRR